MHHHVINIKACWKASVTTRPWYNNHQHFVSSAPSPMSAILYDREWKNQTISWQYRQADTVAARACC